MITRNGKVMAFQDEPAGLCNDRLLGSVKIACNRFFRSRGMPESLARLNIETLAKNSLSRSKKSH
jgi:hypothetical protein